MTDADTSCSIPHDVASILADHRVGLEREICERSLSDFVRLAWPIIDPSAYVGGWHIDVICEHLKAVSDGECRRLLINMPPRHMKSIGVSVAWPAWVWAQTPTAGAVRGPGVRWLFASYALQLSIRDSVKCRRLIESGWYRAMWGDRFRLVGDQNTKPRYDTSCGGYRLSASVDGATTGEGGDIIVIDDPHNVRDAQSDAARQGALDWWHSTMSSRLNDPKTGAFVVIMQRLHQDDLSGHILSQNADGWTHLCLPARYEPSHPFVFAGDRRTKPGELLWPERFGEKELASLEDAMGSHAAAGQLQQRPSQDGGGILKTAWWRTWDKPEPPSCIYKMQCWDTAFSAKTSADYSACTTWGVFLDKRKSPNVILLGARRGRWEYPELRRMAVELAEDHSPDLVLIEKKASGQSLIQDLARTRIPVIGYDPGGTDKVARAYIQSAVLEAGKVWVPAKPWANDVVEECTAFPFGPHDDYVDTVTMALHRFAQGRFVTIPEDSDDDDADGVLNYTRKRVFY